MLPGIIWPETTEVDRQGHLCIGDVDVAEAAHAFGTPLYIFDEATLRSRCREFISEFRSRQPAAKVIYACKAFINKALARLFMEEGLGLDVVSGGELAVARAVSFPMERVYFHGNNKTPQELEEAVKDGVGRIVVDNLHELSMLQRLARAAGRTQEVMLRITPGIDPHTHSHTTTGILDSKFGFPLDTGQAEEALRSAISSPRLKLVGLHFHLGSPIFEMEPYILAMQVVLEFLARVKENYRLELDELSPGGGFAIQYVGEQRPPSVAEYAEAIVGALREGCRRLGLTEPALVLEPGRAIVGRAGVAVYTVGSIKEIPGVRKYVAVDGGMGDNIRPALYDARYVAALASRMDDEASERVTIAGKFCESGDILVKDIALPPVKPGDIIAIPAAGAYAPSMASNYNLNPRPAIVMVKGGKARLIRRRESYDDLMAHDTE